MYNVLSHYRKVLLIFYFSITTINFRLGLGYIAATFLKRYPFFFVFRFYNPVNTPTLFDASRCTLTAIHICMKHHGYWSRLQNLFGPKQIFTA